MEFVEGETLESLIRRSGRLQVKLALEIVAQVTAGLAAVDEQKLVHRDIKPANIMVSLKDGNRVTVKIIDLGLSKTVAESPSQPAISMPGAFAGTPEFASPEQFAGVGVDIRSDLYSLGMTLWEMLTGKVPFRGNPAEVMYEHQHAPLPLEQLIEVPQPIVVLLQVLLEKDPKWRFQNPTALLNALPKVDDAIKARRSIVDQNLRGMADENLAPRFKVGSALSRWITVLGIRRAPPIFWTAVALLAAGGLTAIITNFSAARHRTPSIAALEATNIQGEHPEMNPEFGLARNQLLYKVEENPEDPVRLSTLGQMDAYLGRKQDAIKEARRAVEMLPVSKNPFSGPPLLNNLAMVYALTNEVDLAFQALEVSIKILGGVTYGELQLVHQVSDWYSGAAANFGWMREAKRENTRCGL